MNERQMVETRLGALAVRVRGEGPVAVLWHSLFVDDSTWNSVEDDLVSARRLVIITGPGHGASSDPGRRYTMDECAEAAADVLATLGIDESVDWVGNAWGGHVGVVFAAKWPRRCRNLITLGTPIQSYTLSERLRIWILLPVVPAVWTGRLHCHGHTRGAAVRHDLRTRPRGGQARRRLPAQHEPGRAGQCRRLHLPPAP
jgi:pimeloyl-ACP methyl ester carboxylesterase